MLDATSLDFICDPRKLSRSPPPSPEPGSLVLPGCGHIPGVENTQQYRHTVAEFLRGWAASQFPLSAPPQHGNQAASRQPSNR